ncbi:MAG TPA: histidinol-phosphatase [Nocardioidaceae bacterium]|nr:histidinol-phosphatase [Nocardioidaceae bacterium]
MRSSHTDDLRLAHVMADDSDSLTMSRFKSLDLHVEAKPDLTPVSDADRSVEEAIRRTLGRARPRDAILGEEQGASGWGPRRWVIDPIDGTKNFIRGVPVWATLIALVIDDEVAVGLVSAPALGRRWWASKGDGAWTGRNIMSPTRCQVSDVATLADASLSYSSFSGWEDQGRLEDLLSLGRRCWRTRAYGDFWSHMMVAEGAVDVAVEPDLEVYDMAALTVVVEEAGGRFTSLAGQPGPYGGNALSSNGKLHDQALSYVGSLPPGDDPDEPRRDPAGGSVHDLASRRRPVPRDD